MQRYLEKRTNFQIEAAMRAQEKNQDLIKSRAMEEKLLNSMKAKERNNSRHNGDVSDFQLPTSNYASHPSLP